MNRTSQGTDPKGKLICMFILKRAFYEVHMWSVMTCAHGFLVYLRAKYGVGMTQDQKRGYTYKFVKFLRAAVLCITWLSQMNRMWDLCSLDLFNSVSHKVLHHKRGVQIYLQNRVHFDSFRKIFQQRILANKH